MMYRIAIFFLLLYSTSITCKGQNIITSQSNVSYLETWDKSKHLQIDEIAKITVCLSESENKTIPIFLYIRIIKNDTPNYNLGYDNIYGESINADIYDWQRSDYLNLGVYIGVVDTAFNKEKIVALIEYGINHMSELKKRRRKLMKIRDDRPDTTSLNSTEIENIINKNIQKAKTIIQLCSS